MSRVVRDVEVPGRLLPNGEIEVAIPVPGGRRYRVEVERRPERKLRRDAARSSYRPREGRR